MPQWTSPDRQLRLSNQWVELRPLNPAADSQDLFDEASYAANQADIFRYSLATGPFNELADFTRHLQKRADNPAEIALAVYSRRLGKLVGCISLLAIRPEHGSLELGSIWYGHSARRTEINSNSIYLLLSHCFDDLSYRRVEWKCNNANQASKAAALRLGFQYEGLFRNHFWDKQENRDTAWYSIIDGDWPAVKTRFETRLLRPANNSS